MIDADTMRGILPIIDALDKAEEHSHVYANFVPVFWEDDLIGFLVDEVGGAYSFEVATTEARGWWNTRPRLV